MNLLDGLLSCTLVHPISTVKLLDKFSFDVRDDSVSKVFRASGEGFLDEETAENPT